MQICTFLQAILAGKKHEKARKRSKMHKNPPFCTEACNTLVYYTPVSVHPTFLAPEEQNIKGENFAEENMFAEDISEDSQKIEDITFGGFETISGCLRNLRGRLLSSEKFSEVFALWVFTLKPFPAFFFPSRNK